MTKRLKIGREQGFCGVQCGKVARKTKRPRLKESRDARPNSPPPSAAQEEAYVGTGNMGMAPMGYTYYIGYTEVIEVISDGDAAQFPLRG